MKEFIPGWKQMGLKSKEEGWLHVIRCLLGNKKKILGKSLLNEATFILGDRLITVKGKAKK